MVDIAVMLGAEGAQGIGMVGAVTASFASWMVTHVTAQQRAEATQSEHAAQE